ncbi:MAG: NAD(P)/FAD-dependent oxidoreductase [Burkholderiaceae bacterium]
MKKNGADKVSKDMNGQAATQTDVIVVGAGVSGLYATHKLRQIGLSVTVFEAGADVGGTWYWNRYPGCRCDVESLEYSYSFSEELQQEWHWNERYATQPQILEYLNHVADRFDLRRDIRFNTRIRSAVFDQPSNTWTITTYDGEQIRAPYCVMAVGNLSTPRTPDIPGLDSFEGKWFHTGMWPHAGVDFTGQRVGVIGTGSSGVQSIPLIAAQAKHLTVFQRTANFILPANNGPIAPEVQRQHKAEYPTRRQAAFSTPFGIAGYPPPTQSATDVSDEDRRTAYEAKWQAGGQISFLYAYTDLLTDEESNKTAADFVRNKIRAVVQDRATAELLCPDNHPIGTKRLILDTNYFETFNRDNVDLVDVRSDPIQGFYQSGLHTASGKRYDLDSVVFATGFDAMTGALREIEIKTSDGLQLSEHWRSGPKTYLGLMVAGFPNLFMVTGPQSPGVKSNMMFSIEQHVNWIANCLVYMRDKGLTHINALPDAQDNWVQHNNEVANATLYPKANSWYMGANIPGKPRIFMPYVGGCERYTKTIDSIADSGYRGFNLA